MDNITFRDKIKEVLEDETSRKHLQDCLGQLRDNIKDAQGEVRTFLLTMLLLSVLFVLLGRSAISEVNLGPIKVTDLPLVLKVLPLIIAFVYHSIISKTILITLLRGLHRTVIQNISPKLFESNIDKFLLPPSGFYIHNIFDSFAPDDPKTSTMLWALFSISLFLGVLLVPLCLELYMFWICFVRFGFRDIIVWVSLVFTIILIVQSIVYLVIAQNIDPDTEFSL